MEKTILKKDLLADLTTMKKTDEGFMDKLISESTFLNLLPEIAKEKLKDFFITLYKISLKELNGQFEPFQFLEMLFDLLQIIFNNKSLPRPISISEFCKDKKPELEFLPLNNFGYFLINGNVLYNFSAVET